MLFHLSSPLVRISPLGTRQARGRLASRIWAFQRPLSKPTHMTNKGANVCRRCLDEAGAPYTLALSGCSPHLPFFPASPVHVSQAINSHPLPPGLAPYFNHQSPWQTSKHISAQLLSPSNNMSADAELVTSPVTTMTISTGFPGAGLVSPQVFQHPAPLPFIASSGAPCFSLSYQCPLGSLLPPGQKCRCLLCGLIEYKE